MSDETTKTPQTYDSIKTLRKSGVKPTQEQYQEALEHQRLCVQQTAVSAATLSGENHARHYLPNVDPTIGQQYGEAARSASDASRHLSKLVFWAAKAQAEALGIVPVQALSNIVNQSYGMASVSDLDGDDEDEEDSDEEDDDEADSPF